MKKINWDVNKNLILKMERRICFDDVVYYIENNKVLDLIRHPNQAKYPNQSVFIIQINDYVYLVPFVESQNEIFLKTIVPSRKATHKYLGENYEKERN